METVAGEQVPVQKLRELGLKYWTFEYLGKKAGLAKTANELIISLDFIMAISCLISARTSILQIQPVEIPFKDLA